MTVKIAILQAALVASQAIYMYVSSTEQFRKRRMLFLICIPFVAAFPVAVYAQDKEAYTLYLYSLVMCMVIAAFADVICAAAANREYLTDQTVRRFHYAYFLICIITSVFGHFSLAAKGAAVLLLACVFYYQYFIKKNTASELLKAVPLAAISFFCAWVCTGIKGI